MEEKDTERKALPPYLPYRTFRTFVESLRVAIPGRIDRSLMGTMSGTAQGQLIAALRYLDLITLQGSPTEKLTRLVNSEGTDRQKTLRDILTPAYTFLFHEGFPLERATVRQLEEKFNTAGASGETVRKCIAFFTAAAKAADLPLSPYIKGARGTRGNGGRPRRMASGAAPQDSLPKSQADQTPYDQSEPLTWRQLLLAKFPSFDPSWSEEVKAKWFDAFDRLMRSEPEKKASGQDEQVK